MNVAESPSVPMLEITGVDRIVNPDQINHMPCRPRQVLAYVAARSPWVDLLKYGALGSTFDFYRHCVIQGRNRWAFLPAYAREEDLPALGFQLDRFGTVDLARAEVVRRMLERDRLLMFYAPGGDFPHYSAFLRELGTYDVYARDHHSFMLAGISADGSRLLLVDNANLAHEFGRVVVPAGVVVDGCARDPDNWFVDTVMLGKVGEPDVGAFRTRYLEVVEAFDDRFEIYDLIADRLAAELVPDPDLDHTPSLAMLRMLAGSRALFHEFLRRTDHSAPVTAAYHQLARQLTALVDRTAGFLSGRRGVRLDGLRRDLHALRMREERAKRLLQADLSRVRLTLTPTPHHPERS